MICENSYNMETLCNINGHNFLQISSLHRDVGLDIQTEKYNKYLMNMLTNIQRVSLLSPSLLCCRTHQHTKSSLPCQPDDDPINNELRKRTINISDCLLPVDLHINSRQDWM